MSDQEGKPRERERANGLGSVRQLPSGKWQWSVTVGRDADGKQRRKTGTEKHETAAKKALAAALAEVQRGAVAIPEKLTLGEWLDRWTELKKAALSESTRSNHEGLIRLHIKPAIGRVRLQTLTPRDLEGFYAELVKKKLGTSMQRQAHNVIHAALRHAMKLELVMRNVADVVRPTPTRATVEDQASKALTAAEAGKLIPVLEADRWGAVFLFMLYTGLRRGEACGLRWANVDFERGLIRVHENLVAQNGKASVTTPKTAKSRRTVHLAQEALSLLRRQQETQDLERRALSEARTSGKERKRRWQNTGYVFTALSGVRLNPENLKRSLDRLCEGADIRHITPHAFRHTFASLMLARGVPLEVVSEKLGHSRPSFTADVYRTVYEGEHEEWTVDFSELLRPRSRALN